MLFREFYPFFLVFKPFPVKKANLNHKYLVRLYFPHKTLRSNPCRKVKTKKNKHWTNYTLFLVWGIFILHHAQKGKISAHETSGSAKPSTCYLKFRSKGLRNYQASLILPLHAAVFLSFILDKHLSFWKEYDWQKHESHLNIRFVNTCNFTAQQITFPKTNL